MDKGADGAVGRSDVTFRSDGLRCAAWLYRPVGSARPPVVVMAHGFGALRTFGLAPFAGHFARLGLAALVFDYRTFGRSGGRPRQLISPRRHLEDWAAAISYVRGLDSVDGSRVGLWGTSYSGGHALATAAHDGGIGAAVCQVPYVGLSAGSLPSPESLLRVGRAAAIDLARARSGRLPRRIGIIGEPGEEALLTYSGWSEAYRRLVPLGTQWLNATPARTLPEMLAYRPGRHAEDVRCPVLFVPGGRDRGTPASLVRAVAARMRRATVEELDCDHFDVYSGPHHERARDLAGDFLVEHLT